MTEDLIGAIEAGGTKFVLALARSDGTIIARDRLSTKTASGTLPQVATFFRSGAEQHGRIGGFGIATFGPVDIDPASSRYGTITTSTKPGWSGARYQDALAEFDAPVVIDTDVNGAALGECLAGAGRALATVAYTTVGTGIGTGVIRAGRPLGGFTHFEAGHIRVPRDPVRDPFPGNCPYHGDCVEGLASGRAIAARFGQSLDALADRVEAVDLIAGYLADLSAALVLLHAPDRLIFGGGVMNTPGLLAALRQQTEAKLAGYIVHPRLDPGLRSYIVAPELGEAAGITGAVELGRQAIAESSTAA
ncbi:MAG: ROK family protein [Pseudomonadota bacterium]